MDIDGIRTFVSIAELGGFTRAAGRLHRSQPAISRRISLLEQELGVPLLERERAAVERMLVIAAPEHRLAGRRAGRRKLQGERWIGFPAARGRESFGHILARQLAAAGLDDAPVMLIDSLTAQKRLVEAGFGIGLVPESSVHDELKLGSLAVVTGTPVATTVPVALIYRRKGYLNAAARALIAILTERAGSANRSSGIAVKGRERGGTPRIRSVVAA